MFPQTAQDNPFSVGEVVTMVHANGAGEGVLWRVTAVKGSYLRLLPIWTVTGPSVLNVKQVQRWKVQRVDLVELGTAYLELQNIIQDIARQRAGEDAS